MTGNDTRNPGYLQVGDQVRVLCPIRGLQQPHRHGTIVNVSRDTVTWYTVRTTEGVFDPVHDTYRVLELVRDTDVLLLSTGIADRARAAGQAVLCLRSDAGYARTRLADGGDPKDLWVRFWRRAGTYDQLPVMLEVVAAMMIAFDRPPKSASVRSLERHIPRVFDSIKDAKQLTTARLHRFFSMMADIDPVAVASRQDPRPQSGQRSAGPGRGPGH